MAVSYNTNQIITTGLVAVLDAQNVKSFFSGSTSAADLTGNFNQSINGTVLYTGSYGGAFKFSNSSVGGTIGTSQVPNLVTSPGFTISTWVQHNSLRNTNGFQRYVSLGVVTPSSDDGILRHGYNGSTLLNGGIEAIVFTDASPKFLTIDNVLVVNIPTQLVMTWNGTTMIVYKNAIQIGTSTPGGAYSPTGHRYLALSSNSAESMDGQIFSTLVYNRPLSAAEIKINYDLTRTRFRI